MVCLTVVISKFLLSEGRFKTWVGLFQSPECETFVYVKEVEDTGGENTKDELYVPVSSVEVIPIHYTNERGSQNVDPRFQRI